MFPSQNPASPQYAAQKQKQPTASQQPSASGIAGTSGASANAAAVSSNPNMQKQQPAPQRNYYGQPPKPVGQQPAQAYQPPMMSAQTAAGFGMPAGSGQPQAPMTSSAPHQNADQVAGMGSAPGPAALGSFMGTGAGDPWSGAQGKPLDGGTSDLGPLGDAGIEQQPQGMTRRPMQQRSYYGQ